MPSVDSPQAPPQEFVRRNVSFRPQEFAAVKAYASLHGLRCNSAVISHLLQRAKDAGWLPIELFNSGPVMGARGDSGMGDAVAIPPRVSVRQTVPVHVVIDGGAARVVIQGRSCDTVPWETLTVKHESGVYNVPVRAQMRVQVPLSMGAAVRVLVQPYGAPQAQP